MNQVLSYFIKWLSVEEVKSIKLLPNSRNKRKKRERFYFSSWLSFKNMFSMHLNDINNCIIYWYILLYFWLSSLCLFVYMVCLTCSTQHMWNPAPGASGQKSHPLQFLLLLHCHLLNCGLWRRHSPHMALPAPGGHHDLCGSGGATSAGRKVSK